MKDGMELHGVSRNSNYKNLDVADAGCCGELWRGVSIKILPRFVQSVASHTTRFLENGVLCAALLLGSLAHLVFHRSVEC